MTSWAVYLNDDPPKTVTALAEQIVGTGESWLTDLSTAALREVLTLSPEAVTA